MDELQTRLLATLPSELNKFLDTLTGNELNKLNNVDLNLIAKVYQAGAAFSLTFLEAEARKSSGNTNE